MTERRVTCPRHHWLFSVTEAGISIKCRAGECRVVYVVTWAELEAKRREVEALQEAHGDDKIAV
jgi:hypothetical protein